MAKNTSPYVGRVNGIIGVYCTKCKTKLNSKDKFCPGCFRIIK